MASSNKNTKCSNISTNNNQNIDSAKQHYLLKLPLELKYFNNHPV